MKLTTNRNKTVFPLGIIAATLLFTACGSTPEEAEPVTSVVTVTKSAEDRPVVAPEFVDIDPSVFASRSSRIMDYRMGDSTGTCTFDEFSVTCTGRAAANVPDVSIPPFQGRPGAISVTADGYSYTIFEGVPSAPAALLPGQRMTFGSVTCSMPEQALNCAVGENSFSINAQDRLITPSGQPAQLAPEPTTPSASPTPIDGDYSAAEQKISTGPTLCGAATARTLVEIVHGSVSCDEAITTVDHYLNVAHAEGGGNALFVDFGEWMCSSPTAGRSQELKASVVCENSTKGVRVEKPIF